MPPPPRLRLSSRDCGKQLLEPREGTTTAVGGDILHASHAGAPEQPTLLEGGLAVLGERHLECRQCLLHAWTAPHAAIEVQRPFLPLHPGVYAKLLGERIAAHRAQVWLINTGWTGGPYGSGRRLPLAQTRAMLRAALSGGLESVRLRPDPLLRLDVPVECPQASPELLEPRRTWADPALYDKRARELAQRFQENFRQFESQVSPQIREAGPRL